MKKNILLPLIFWLMPIFASAAGIQVTPAKLDFILPASGKTSQNITVVNPAADIQLFQVYVDDFSDTIKAMPVSFTLEAGARKTVTISVNTSLNKNSGTMATNLSVIGKALSDTQGFAVGTGVKIPLSITQTAPNNTQTLPKTKQLLLLAAVIIIITCWSIYVHKLNKK
jgi:hypothetical protein